MRNLNRTFHFWIGLSTSLVAFTKSHQLLCEFKWGGTIGDPRVNALAIWYRYTFFSCLFSFVLFIFFPSLVFFLSYTTKTILFPTKIEDTVLVTIKWLPCFLFSFLVLYWTVQPPHMPTHIFHFEKLHSNEINLDSDSIIMSKLFSFKPMVNAR
jgi:hypothetical protein